jgi:hypothetical protein
MVIEYRGVEMNAWRRGFLNRDAFAGSPSEVVHTSTRNVVSSDNHKDPGGSNGDWFRDSYPDNPNHVLIGWEFFLDSCINCSFNEWSIIVEVTDEEENIPRGIHFKTHLSPSMTEGADVTWRMNLYSVPYDIWYAKKHPVPTP